MTVQRFSIFGESVDFIDCPEFASGFQSILRGWRMDPMPYDETPAYVTIEKKRDRYRWNAPWLVAEVLRKRRKHRTVFDAVCEFHYEFIDWYAEMNPDFFCLHTAGIGFAGKAVLFPCEQKAGKSLLTVQLAQRGHRVFGDDVVALTAGAEHVTAIGILPRLRLPLPYDALDDEVVRYIADRNALSDRHYQYVALDDHEVCRLGEEMPVGGVVLLKRGRPGPARLEPTSQSDALKALIDRNFGRLRDPNGIFDRLREVVRASACFTLHYELPRDAAEILEDQFG